MHDALDNQVRQVGSKPDPEDGMHPDSDFLLISSHTLHLDTTANSVTCYHSLTSLITGQAMRSVQVYWYRRQWAPQENATEYAPLRQRDVIYHSVRSARGDAPLQHSLHLPQ